MAAVSVLPSSSENTAVKSPWSEARGQISASATAITSPISPSERMTASAAASSLHGSRVSKKNTITFEPSDEPQTVWTSGDVRVSAIRATHIPGNVAYRIDTPAGSVVIGGDAVNDVLAPPRNWSTSDQVEKLAKGADVIVHSAIHPVMGPGKGSGMYPYAYYRQSTAPDLGAMAERAGAKYLILTHLIPPIGADQQYPFKVPGRPLTEADYREAAKEGGFTGTIVVGTDLASLRLPAK